MKINLGLDIGTNSIGWALSEHDFEKKEGVILGMGSRIIPMSQDILGNFGRGNTVSQTAERTRLRSVRRLRERQLLRRERLHRVLNSLGFLPDHYTSSIDFIEHPGKFKVGIEPKIAYTQVIQANGKQGFEFLFKESFHEMLAEFKLRQPVLLKNENGEDKLIPYDWTLYFLRKKALHHKIQKEELSWIILNFNQKRGYYQRGEELQEDKEKKEIELHTLKITDVKAEDEKNSKKETWYSVTLENGWIYRRSSKIPLFGWKGKTRDFIVTTEINEDGSYKLNKDGSIRRSFRAPNEDDWTLQKKKTENRIESAESVGAYIYSTLLESPNQKIKGDLVRTIERKFYKEELKLILETQKRFHPELSDKNLLQTCIKDLYANNSTHRSFLEKKDWIHLILDDVLFYQRPLRSKKSLIADCPLEFRHYRDRDGKIVTKRLKVIPKTHPLFQEFRLWQWISNLRIFTRESETDITPEFLSGKDELAELFDFLFARKEVDQKTLIKHLLQSKDIKGKPAEIAKYRWNYVEEKKYPCNETGSMIRSRLEKVEDFMSKKFSDDEYLQLWHIIYSITDKDEYTKALKTFAKCRDLDSKGFVEAFKSVPSLNTGYGAYSEKAIKKLLPLLRSGNYWNWDNVDPGTQERISNIITGEFNEGIKERVRVKAINLKENVDFSGLPLWLAQYIVYDRHSESSDLEKWQTPEDITRFLDNFQQHSLRNPIVEQIAMETFRVVRDIWKHYGKSTPGYFDEIHIELARELKSTAEERARTSAKMLENSNKNIRIRALLAELVADNIPNVRPYSPIQQELLKVYEDGVLGSDVTIDDDILKIARSAEPTREELRKYKLWLEQKYRSPYTGEVIPLSKLFTPEYEIEHIIPQSRYFDDSASNKVICESAVNRLKDNKVGLEFIKNFEGQIVECGLNRKVKVFKREDYEDFVKTHYAKDRNKKLKLLAEDIPEEMSHRQLNDTRYVSRFISGVLSKIVRQETKDEGMISKNIVTTSGRITAELRKDWGLDDIWNELVLPRFVRMNEIQNTTEFTTWNERIQKTLPRMPVRTGKGNSSKRIDHRHHALDALVVACTSRNHINLLNNINAKSTLRYDLNKKLRHQKKATYLHPITGETIERMIPTQFIKPWPSFSEDAKNSLQSIIVSFKQNLRIINKATNYYTKWADLEGKKVKKKINQRGINWAIRKSLHKDSVSAKVDLKRIKTPKGKIITAIRKPIGPDFDKKTLESITDTGIQKILRNFLEKKGLDFEQAFSPEGLEELNANIREYNDGRDHKPIRKLRIFETGTKFPVGYKGNKGKKYVEADKGTNLFFAVYENEEGKRTFDSIPLNVVIERLKQGLGPIPEKNTSGMIAKFFLNPNDLVYLPDEEGGPDFSRNNIDPARIYKLVSCTGNQAFFIKHDVSTSILDKMEFSPLNKMERSIDGIMIKEKSIKLNVDRLGNIK